MHDNVSKYPIGQFNEPSSYTVEYIQDCINEIRELPNKVRELVKNRTEEQMNDSYRVGGWTFRQIVHHLADSHLHALIRIKYTLTENIPVIKPFEEADWALLPDYKMPVESSLKMLEGIHLHLTILLEALSDDEWDKCFFHPVSGAKVSLRKLLAIYAWHGKHHLAHLKAILAKY